MTLYKDFVKQSITDDIQSLGIEESSTNNVSGNKSVTFPPTDRYYDSMEWYALSKNDKANVLKERININGGKKSTKSGEHYNSGGGCNNEQWKLKYKIAMLENKVRNQKRQLSVFNTAVKPGLDDEESGGSDK